MEMKHLMEERQELTNLEDAIRHEVEQVVHLLLRKRRDYGEANLGAEYDIVRRMGDKHARLKNLVPCPCGNDKKKPANESVEDSFMDMIGYSLLALMKRHGTLSLPLPEHDTTE